ncbi:hypothetical protein M5K25_028075 [Dendrobium thyrsiflorum]|uniref:Uncharacterized protein n=1 Tax=Dendrobium thyrsiflorum TaxID=117978 RepID=A0ABD0TVF3_DENTH
MGETARIFGIAFACGKNFIFRSLKRVANIWRNRRAAAKPRASSREIKKTGKLSSHMGKPNIHHGKTKQQRRIQIVSRENE